MDIVYINALKIDTVIGIYAWERRIKQTVTFDIEMGTDVRAAVASDNIDDALNYKAVSQRLLEDVGNSNFQLVEALAEHVASLILAEFPVLWLRLRVNKQGALRHACDVGVLIERRRADDPMTE